MFSTSTLDVKSYTSSFFLAVTITPNTCDSTKQTSPTFKLANRRLLLRSDTSPLLSLGESLQVHGQVSSEIMMIATPEPSKDDKSEVNDNPQTFFLIM